MQRPPKAKIAIHRADGTEEAVNVFIVHERRENIIRRAVNNTFPHAVTLNDMLKMRLGVGPDNVTVGDVGPNNVTVSYVGPDNVSVGDVGPDNVTVCNLDVINSDSDDNDSTEPSEPAQHDLGPPVQQQCTRTTMRSYPGKHVAAARAPGASFMTEETLQRVHAG